MIKTTAVLSLFVLSLAGTALAADAEKGKASYEVCAACHGADGAGNSALNAPAVGGMPAWYVTRQLQNFKSGARGADAKDIFGTQMAPMAMTLTDDAAIENVAAYIESLAAAKAEATLKGDVEKGQKAYATCGACHGADGSGVEAMNAPPLAGQHDWYIERQLVAYKSGWRGTAEKDTFGKQMRPMAMMLATDEALRDVAAYIATLD